MKFFCLSVMLFFSCLFCFSVTAGYAEMSAVSRATGGDSQAAVAPPSRQAVSPQGKREFPVIRKMQNGRYRLGNIIINKEDGHVMVKGVVNMQEGLVEYLACGPNGKLHESVLMLDVDPYFLQIALLLIGIEPGNRPISGQGANEKPVGDPVELWVTWTGKDKKMKKYRAEQLIFNKKKNAPMQKTHWIFTGSVFSQGRFLASVEQSIAAVYHDPAALFDHPLKTGADDTVCFVNSALVPPKGTPVNFVVHKVRTGKRWDRINRRPVHHPVRTGKDQR